jgi:signal transduction histidine kinase
MNFYVNYKDFDKKPDNEKVTDSEISNELLLFEKYKINKQQEATNNYYNLIREAQNRGDYDSAKRLNEQMTKKIEDIRNENSRTSDEIRTQIIKWKTKDYEDIKSSLMQNSYIKYYIKDNNTNEVRTNIDSSINIEYVNNYIKENALYSIHFPYALIHEGNFYVWTNTFFNNSSMDGYIIIPKDIKNSYIYKDYEYYNAIRDRVIKEQFILIPVILITLALLIYIIRRKNLYSKKLTRKIMSFINEIPLDLKLIIFFMLSLIVLTCMNNVYFFYMPINIKHFLSITLISILIIFPLLISINVAGIVTNRNRLKAEIKSSTLISVLSTIKYGLKYKKASLKLIVVFIATVLFGIYICLIFRQYNYYLLIYIIIYALIVPFYILKNFFNLCKIVDTTDKIISGNLNYEVKIAGKSINSKLANNINNMKLGFKKAVENQVKSERLKSELITNVSHDLKTPLTSIINYVDLLKRDDVTEDEKISYISILDKKSQRLKVLIEDLFEASKLSSGNIELNIEKIDVTSLLKQALGEANHKIEESNLTFKINIPKGKMYSNLDGKRTWRVFDNLINNALKYSQPNTRVYIDLVGEDENIIFTIKNISAYELDFNSEEIFERFKRGDSSRSTEGSGLGLAIARSIVELEQGSINIHIDGDLFKVTVKFKKDFQKEVKQL